MKEKQYSLSLVLFYSALMLGFIIVQLYVFGVFSKDEVAFSIERASIEDHVGELQPIKISKDMYLPIKRKITKDNLISQYLVDTNAKSRTLDQYYSRRAYLGAPPYIPHPVENKLSLTGSSCLTCHEFGGYSPKYNAFAPVVPHPENLNCRQCHNPQTKTSLFKNTQWQKEERPKLGQSALPGSPPVIPHSLQLRENCSSCHTGPGAVAEIRINHGNRVNCLQCHGIQQGIISTPTKVEVEKVWVREK